MLANLNARSYRPTSPDHIHGNDNGSIPHVSTLRFATGQPQNREGHGERSARIRTLSFIRSVARTTHRVLTETPDERTSRMREEARLAGLGGGVSGRCHNEESGSGEVSGLSLPPILAACD